MLLHNSVSIWGIKEFLDIQRHLKTNPTQVLAITSHGNILLFLWGMTRTTDSYYARHFSKCDQQISRYIFKIKSLTAKTSDFLGT